MKKQLQEQLTALHKEANDIRKEFDGKPGDMPGDKLERWEKCLAEADTVQRQLAALEKQESLEKAADVIQNAMPQVLKATGGDAEEMMLRKAWGELVSLRGGKEEYRKSFVEFAQKKGLSVGSAPGGGYFVVPQEIASEVIRLVQDDVFVRRYARSYTVTEAESLGIITMGDMNDFDWTDELNTGSEDTNEPFGKRELAPKPMAKRFKLSKKLMRMTPQPEQEVMNMMSYLKARTEEKGFLLGDGFNKPLGIMTASADGISTGRDRATGTANVVGGDDYINALADMKGAYRLGARWVLHRNLEGRTRKLKDGQNNYIWSPFGGVGQGIQGGFAPTILGMPYDLSEFITDPGLTGNITTGTYAAALCNYGRGYRIVDALTMEVQPLYELYAANNQMGYIFRAETDGMPVDENAFVRIKVS